MTASNILAERGFETQVMEGFRAWEAENMPIETAAEGETR